VPRRSGSSFIYWEHETRKHGQKEVMHVFYFTCIPQLLMGVYFETAVAFKTLCVQLLAFRKVICRVKAKYMLWEFPNNLHTAPAFFITSLMNLSPAEGKFSRCTHDLTVCSKKINKPTLAKMVQRPQVSIKLARAWMEKQRRLMCLRIRAVQ